ncbi:MAG: phospholipase C type enzyme [Cirrosporium novae-zelandiae]|nr:MAG: phospholipase C type enzyme [Cirrosporium novae-zelandiae]
MASPDLSISESSPNNIKVFSLNCWGLKYISKQRHERLVEIGKRIALLEPEIVGLQECWTAEDFQSIRIETRRILPFGKFYHSGIFGGGLAILSRWPIIESSMFRYPLNGRPTAFWRGDWYVGKGVACATIRTGPNQDDIVDVFCTHLHAPYEREPNDSYICHRTAQAWEIAKLMRGAAEKGHLVIGLGDFNMIPMSLAHRLITTYSPVKDTWRELHPDSSIGAAVDSVERSRNRPIPTAEFNLQENGATCDSVLNTWRWNKEQQKRLNKGEDVAVPLATLDSRAKRLDYIFIGHASSSRSTWKVKEARVGMTERHAVLHCSLSDHFSIEATISRDASAHTTPRITRTTQDEDAVSPAPASPAIEVTINNIPLGPLGKDEPLSPAFLSEILAMISTYTLRERRQRRLRLSHFIGSLAISVGSLIAVWWVPHNYIAFILMLISTLGLAAGVTDGLIGGLFVGSELRALKEFEWEIRNEWKRGRKESGETEAAAEEAVRDWND